MKTLLLLHRVPWPRDKGDRLRSYGILRRLSEISELHVGAFADGSDPVEAATAADQLRPLCASICVVPRPSVLRGALALATGRSFSEEVFSSARLDAYVRGVLAEAAGATPFDAAVAYSSQMARHLLDLPAGCSPGSMRRVVDLVDVDSAKWRRRFEATKNPVHWLEARRVAALERRCIRELDATLVVSLREAEHLGGESDRVRVMRMGVDLSEFSPRPTDPGGDRIAFVGAMDYPPNADGVLWFARDVLPLVRRSRPNATFVVIGRNPPAALRDLPGVELTGWVDDIRQVLTKAAVAVVPIRTSHGVQTKAVVTMGLGVPQVMTSAALAGLDLESGIHALSADLAPDFAAKVISLLDNSDVRVRIAAAARRFAETRFDVEHNLDVLCALLAPGARATQTQHAESTLAGKAGLTRGRISL